MRRTILVIGLVIGLALALPASCVAWQIHHFAPYNDMLRAAFNGHVDPTATTPYDFECPAKVKDQCEEWLRTLPPASGSTCSRLRNEAGAPGACCHVDFPGDRLEVHAFKQSDGRWSLGLRRDWDCL